MKSRAENDIVVFGSGFMRDDDDDSCCPIAKYSSLCKSDQPYAGVPIYLSPIKEWLIEYGSSLICITI
jgi:DNA (cytosine-5)-methyltransferase 1